MCAKAGDTIDALVVDSRAFGAWLQFGDEIGFIDHREFSRARPIPDSLHPVEGKKHRVKVFRRVEELDDIGLPEWVTACGEYDVAFFASAALLEDEEAT